MKNVLVVAAPAAAGVLGQRRSSSTPSSRSSRSRLAASGTYFLNDAFDVEADRRHAKKRFRPIAAGDGPGVDRPASSASLLLVCRHRVLVPRRTGGWRSSSAIYIVFTTTYSAWLKHVAVIDLGMVAAGFVLRLIAGAVAVDVPISVWFIVVGSFGSLFMVAGKRHAEHLELGVDRAGHRATLDEYSVEYLGYVRSVASGVAMVALLPLGVRRADPRDTGIVWFEISIVPFVLAFLRYALLVERGQGGAPEDVVLMDRPLQVLGVLWVVTRRDRSVCRLTPRRAPGRRACSSTAGAAPRRRARAVATPLNDDDVGRLLDGRAGARRRRPRARPRLRRRGAERRRPRARRHRALRASSPPTSTAGVVTAGAGTSLAGPHASGSSRAAGSPVTPGTRLITVGGAIAQRHPRQGPPPRRHLRQQGAVDHPAHRTGRDAHGHPRRARPTSSGRPSAAWGSPG